MIGVSVLTGLRGHGRHKLTCGLGCGLIRKSQNFAGLRAADPALLISDFQAQS